MYTYVLSYLQRMYLHMYRNDRRKKSIKLEKTNAAVEFCRLNENMEIFVSSVLPYNCLCFR